MNYLFVNKYFTIKKIMLSINKNYRLVSVILYFMYPIHFFCWVDGGGDGVIKRDTTQDLEEFKRYFNVKIPYISLVDKKVSASDVNTFDFMDMLDKDFKNEKDSDIARKTKELIETFKQSNNKTSNKICAIVDLMKIYLMGKENSLCLDFNCELVDYVKYKQWLDKADKISLSCGGNENKYGYIPDSLEDKSSFSAGLINKIYDVVYNFTFEHEKISELKKIKDKPNKTEIDNLVLLDYDAQVSDLQNTIDNKIIKLDRNIPVFQVLIDYCEDKDVDGVSEECIKAVTGKKSYNKKIF